MFLSRSCEYAIQAVLCVAQQQGSDFVPIRKIAEQTELSYHFLGKILQTLTKKGLLKSYKGPHGGIILARSADEIKLIEIVDAVDGLDFYNRCLIGLPNCGKDQPCRVHPQWGKIREEIFRMFDNTTIAMLIENHQKPKKSE